mgnify:FL=1
MSGIVAIGGGQAGFSFVQKLRSLGCNQKITLVCGEDIVPYQRPPLSKKFLLGEMSKQQLLLRPESYYNDKNINLIIGKNVLRINRDMMEIELEDGAKLPYKKLFLGIGSSPKKLSDKRIYQNKCLHYIRNFKDVELVSKEFDTKKSLLIIGGGYIGLEIAAVARKRGLNVSIIESKDRILKRVTSERVGDYFRKLHKEKGVKIKESVKIEDFLFEGKTFKGVLTNKGETIRGDFIIAGIGIKPNIKIAEESGLLVENGILVDEYCRTNDPNIFAAGDCASFIYQGKRIRLESVGNAIEQSEVAALATQGGRYNYKALPWFWSDQFNVKLQIAGLNFGYTEVVERNLGERLSYWYYKDDKFIAVDAINDPVSYMVGKKLIEKNQTPSQKDIAKESFDLKNLLKG